MNKSKDQNTEIFPVEDLTQEDESLDQYLQKHDNLLRALMGNIKVATEFFNEHLPFGIKQKIDFKTLSFCKETYIDQSLKKRMVDALYKVDFQHTQGYLYLLCEHQS